MQTPAASDFARSDDEFLDDMASGDAAAVGRGIDHFFPLISGVARSVTGHHALAGVVVEETIVSIVRNARSQPRAAGARRWVTDMARERAWSRAYPTIIDPASWAARARARLPLPIAPATAGRAALDAMGAEDRDLLLAIDRLGRRGIADGVMEVAVPSAISSSRLRGALTAFAAELERAAGAGPAPASRSVGEPFGSISAVETHGSDALPGMLHRSGIESID